MISSLLKRAIPFALTMMVGTGLGSIFSAVTTNQKETSASARSYTTTEFGRSCRTKKFKHSYYSNHSQLTITFKPIPRFTEAAQRNRTQGVVRLSVEFGKDGKVKVLDRLATLPDGLTEEAESIAEGTQFKPETLNGDPISIVREMQVRFYPGNLGSAVY